jgi:CRP-like cAMP-binding protein
VERDRVAAIPFFAGLPDAELALVADMASEHEFAEGDTLATEGDFGHAMFALERGTADVVSHGVKIGAVGPGDVVGEIAVLAAGRRMASVVATSPIRAIGLFKRDVWALERKAPEAAQRLRAVLEQRIAELEKA